MLTMPIVYLSYHRCWGGTCGLPWNSSDFKTHNNPNESCKVTAVSEPSRMDILQTCGADNNRHSTRAAGRVVLCGRGRSCRGCGCASDLAEGAAPATCSRCASHKSASASACTHEALLVGTSAVGKSLTQ